MSQPGPIQIQAWQYGVIPPTSGITQPFFWDINRFDEANWDVTVAGSSFGVTERIPFIYVTSATIITLPSTLQSGQPTQISGGLNVHG